MKELLRDVQVGKQYVCFDGTILPASAKGIRFEGWHAEHDLDVVPQVAALHDPNVMTDVLCNEGYWKVRAVPRDL